MTDASQATGTEPRPLTSAMERAIQLIGEWGKIEADWRNGFNSCGKWMAFYTDYHTPKIRMVTLDALVKRGVLTVEVEYTYHGHGEYVDHQIYIPAPPSRNGATEGE